MKRNILTIGLMLAMALPLAAAEPSPAAAAESLESGFLKPPASARPHTWWHWMNGNITREGITADLEAMARVGSGGNGGKVLEAQLAVDGNNGKYPEFKGNVATV